MAVEPPVMVPVGSSNVAAIGYDDDEDDLWIEYTWGGLYRYYNVSEQRFRALMDAPSKGQYVNKIIRKLYPYERMR